MTQTLPREVFESEKIQKGLERMGKLVARATEPREDENLFKSLMKAEELRNAMGYLMHECFIAGMNYKGKFPIEDEDEDE